jgi:hypothetical protein
LGGFFAAFLVALYRDKCPGVFPIGLKTAHYKAVQGGLDPKKIRDHTERIPVGKLLILHRLSDKTSEAGNRNNCYELNARSY